MNFTLRAMWDEDLDQVRAIAVSSPEAPQWPSGIYDSYQTGAEQRPIFRSALVAEREGQILAFAFATLLLDGEQNLCQLDSIAVRGDARRLGLGTALLRALLAWAFQNGARHFSLEVRESNARAIGLYGGLGLLPEGRRRRYYTHPEEDALVLGRPVTADTP